MSNESHFPMGEPLVRRRTEYSKIYRRTLSIIKLSSVSTDGSVTWLHGSSCSNHERCRSPTAPKVHWVALLQWATSRVVTLLHCVVRNWSDILCSGEYEPSAKKPKGEGQGSSWRSTDHQRPPNRNYEEIGVKIKKIGMERNDGDESPPRTAIPHRITTGLLHIWHLFIRHWVGWTTCTI